jgi:hypothetical protein
LRATAFVLHWNLFVEVKVRWISQLSRMNKVHGKEPLQNQIGQFNNLQQSINIKQIQILVWNLSVCLTKAKAMQIAPTAMYAVPRKSFFPLLHHRSSFSTKHSHTGAQAECAKPEPAACSHHYEPIQVHVRELCAAAYPIQLVVDSTTDLDPPKTCSLN